MTLVAQDAPVTPQEIVELILEEMRSAILPGYYNDFVRNVFHIYLPPANFERLRRLHGQIRDDAVRALEEELASLNKGRAGLSLPWQQQHKKKRRCEPVGPWAIHFHQNTDEDAVQHPVIVESEEAPPPEPPTDDGSAAPAGLEGTPTIRIQRNHTPPPPSETVRSLNMPPVSANAVSYARLSYEDDTGTHDYVMTKDLIKIGRGGANEWVDLKLRTRKDVSREHFQIRRDSSGRFLIKDLSTFGTWVDGNRVPPSVEKVNGVERDLNLEVPLPAKARINLADVMSIKFKALTKS